jgi:low affinity Fe/Cu permease
MCLALCFGMIAVFFMLWKKVINCCKICTQEKRDNFWWEYSRYADGASMDFSTFVLTIITCIAVILFLCIVCDCTNSIMQWTFVPEVKILEMLKGYVQ